MESAVDVVEVSETAHFVGVRWKGRLGEERVDVGFTEGETVSWIPFEQTFEQVNAGGRG